MANDPITQRGSLHTRTEAALPCAGRAYGEALKGVALPGEQKGTPRNSN